MSNLGGVFVKRVFIFMMFLLLAACSDHTLKEDTIHLDKDNQKETREVEAGSSQHEEPNLGEQPEPQPSHEINLLDPNTQEIIATISANDLGYYTDYFSYEQKIEQLAKDLARGTESTPGYDRRMTLDKVTANGKLVEGHPMVLLKESELVERILTVSPDGGEVELPLYTTKTGYDRSEFDSLDDVVIASYTTYFKASDIGRTHNIRQSSDAISKVIVGVGDYFSFNTTVGPRTKETGYQEALEIVNGEFVLGIGGGICQTSSTLFNAVDQLAVEYVEWHHHSRDIGYVPKGRDATVSFGSLDFRFQNTVGYPFMIISKTNENSITVEIRTSEYFAYH